MRQSLLGLLIIVLSGVAAADTITIRADEWLPYNGPETRKPPGYMIEMADAIAAANGHQIEYANLPWVDAKDAAEKGNIDCVVGALKTDAPNFEFPQQPWGLSTNGYFKMAETNWTYQGLESLEQVRLVVIDDYSYSDEIDAYIAANRDDPSKIVVVNSTGRALVKAIFTLISGKGDVLIEDIQVARAVITRMKMADRILLAAQATEPKELYVACTPQNPRGKKFAAMFSDGTEPLRSSGKLAEILEKYQVEDWLK